MRGGEDGALGRDVKVEDYSTSGQAVARPMAQTIALRGLRHTVCCFWKSASASPDRRILRPC
jgi:hypothetical protein